MRDLIELSSEAATLLKEVIAHESESNYWSQRFEGLSNRDDTILRGSFQELREKKMIAVQWADNIPYYIQVLRDGYLYEEKIQKTESTSHTFEEELHALISRAQNLKAPSQNLSLAQLNDFPHQQSVWLNDAEMFYEEYLQNHRLGDRIKMLLSHRSLDTVSEVLAVLESIDKDTDFISRMSRGDTMSSPEYDVFLSHANQDKVDYVDDLNKSLSKLGVKIFYDKDVISWGDKWKDVILKGTAKAEFAIIVISEHFFGREWTEKELNEFLNRQNQSGQKIILPILYDISSKQLAEQYPELGEIQALHSDKYTTDEIALLFARELIKRLKEQ